MIVRKPHILHVIDALAIGGAERMLVDIANASVADGYRVTVCITRSRADLAAELDSRIRKVILGRERRFDFDAMRRFHSNIKDLGVDIIHVHGRSSLSFVLTCKILYPYPVEIILHDHLGIELDSSAPLWFQLFGNRILSAYIGVYDKLGGWAAMHGISKAKIFVVGNGLNLQRINIAAPVNIRKEFGIHEEHLVGVMVAGLRREKGLDLLIESLSILNKKSPPFKVLIVGGYHDPTYVRECKSAAKQKGISDMLIFAGARTDVASLIHSADFALMPSRSESGPLVLIEYMSAQLPLIYFRIGDIAQKAAHHNVPGAIEPNNVTGFSQALSVMLTLDTEARLERGNYGRHIAERYFSIEVKMPQFYHIYRNTGAFR